MDTDLYDLIILGNGLTEQPRLGTRKSYSHKAEAFNYGRHGVVKSG